MKEKEKERKERRRGRRGRREGGREGGREKEKEKEKEEGRKDGRKDGRTDQQGFMWWVYLSCSVADDVTGTNFACQHLRSPRGLGCEIPQPQRIFQMDRVRMAVSLHAISLSPTQGQPAHRWGTCPQLLPNSSVLHPDNSW